MRKQYKIMPSAYSRGRYRVKIWRWWFPFWIETSILLEFETVEEAKKYIRELKNPIYL